MKKKNATAAARRPASRTETRRVLAARLDLGAGMVLTLLAAGLHAMFLTHAGPLWRDEVQIFNVSTAPTFAEQWQLNEYDTFPLLWQVTLRAWTMAGFGETDFGLRVLGFLVGLAILGMLWYCAHQFERRSPLVSLVIFGLSPAVIVYGDSIRGYGFGTIWLLFMIARLWRMVREPTVRNSVWAGVASILAVQSFYFSVPFFALLWFIAMAMFLHRKDWRPALALTGIGVVAAASMVPYLKIVQRQVAWLLQWDIGAWWLIVRFKDAVNASGKNVVWVWAALVLLALFVYIRGLRSTPSRDQTLFAGGMLVGGPVIYILFLVLRRQPTQVWYYIAIMGFLAVIVDAAVSRLTAASWKGNLARVTIALVGSIIFISGAWPWVHWRMSNIDRVAETLHEKAGKDDFILINPWWPGVTFNRYYRGSTPWMTLPDLGPLHVQRYDLFREKLFEPEPIKPVLDQITKTLKGGHRVWIIGGLTFLKPGEEPGSVPPAPVGPISESPYMEVWSRQAGFLVQSHVTKAEPIPVSIDNPVSPFENFGLLVVEGWR